MRNFLGWLLIKAGMAALRPETREMVRKIIMYHVPGALTDVEKSEVRAAKTTWMAQL